MAKLPFSLRGVALLVALGLAALATVALSSYIRGAQQAAAEELEPVDAFVATGVIPAGTTAEEAVAGGLISTTQVPRNNVVPGAIGSLQQLTGTVASVDILTGEQIVGARFVQPSEARGMLPIPDDKQAMSVEVAVPPGVAGFVESGDRVSVIAELEIAGSDGAPDPTDDQGEPADETETRVQFLLQGVDVLAVGQRVVTTDETGQDGTTVRRDEARVLMTLAVGPTDAERLAFAILNGEVYFTLLPDGHEAVETPGVTAETAFPR